MLFFVRKHMLFFKRESFLWKDFRHIQQKEGRERENNREGERIYRSERDIKWCIYFISWLFWKGKGIIAGTIEETTTTRTKGEKIFDTLKRRWGRGEHDKKRQKLEQNLFQLWLLLILSTWIEVLSIPYIVRSLALVVSLFFPHLLQEKMLSTAMWNA